MTAATSFLHIAKIGVVPRATYPAAAQRSEPTSSACTTCDGLRLGVATKPTLPPSWSLSRALQSVAAAAELALFLAGIHIHATSGFDTGGKKPLSFSGGFVEV